MRICTTDPISGRDITDVARAPFVVEGTGDSALKIYFESEANRSEYLGVELEHPGQDLSVSLDNPQPMGGERKRA